MPSLTVPAVGLEFAEDQLQQRRLACAVRADQAETVAAQDAQVEIADDVALAVRLADALQFGDELAGALAGVDGQLDVADSLAPRLAIARATAPAA